MKIFFLSLIVASSGEYVPVMVDHSDDLPCRGVYFLHHGLQRRIRITIGNLFQLKFGHFWPVRQSLDSCQAVLS